MRQKKEFIGKQTWILNLDGEDEKLITWREDYGFESENSENEETAFNRAER